MTKVGLVDDVGRGAEFIGDFGQRHPTDTEPAQLIDVSGQWPYRPVYSGRGGVPQRRQITEEQSPQVNGSLTSTAQTGQ